MIDACDECLRRTDLIVGLFGFIDIEWRREDRPRRVLTLPDEALTTLDASGTAQQRYESFKAEAARERIRATRMSALCRCSEAYPECLSSLADPPAVLHALGRLGGVGLDAVAIVGARRGSAYGTEVGRSLGRGLGAAGLTVVSGMAMGIDSDAHAGTLDGGGHTVAVLAGGADIPYPAHKRHLHRRILESGGAVVSEWPPGAGAHRWSFVARNRIIAGLAGITVVIEGTVRSGSLTTAGFAAEAGRLVGAVPGPVTSRLSAGPNDLIAEGALLVRDAADVLDALLGPGEWESSVPRAADQIDLPQDLGTLLASVEAGRDTPGRLLTTGDDVEAILRGLTELELRGLLRRLPDGRYLRTA